MRQAYFKIINTMSKLTDKQKRFCEEYMIDMNATQAAIRAGYSKKTAKDIGCENLAKPNISQYIQELQGKLSDKLEITREHVLSEYAKIAFNDPRKAFSENDTLKKIVDFDDDIAGAISSIEIIEDIDPTNGKIQSYTKKLRFLDKKGALDSVCKVLGYNEPEKFEVKNKIAYSDMTEEQLQNEYRRLAEKEGSD